MYAIQLLKTGEVYTTFESIQEAQKFMNNYPKSSELFTCVDTTNKSKLSVEYAEMSGPWGYGHQEVSFETYGSLMECIRRFYNWVFETAKVFGPDWRDVYDYFRNCSLIINGKSYDNWFIKQKEKITKDKIYI